MAELGPELFSEQELTCSICLDLFSEPVSTPCGHNFCQSCIGGYWASSAECTCPLCKRPFDGRPELSINRVFAHIAQKYKEMRYGGPPPVKPRQKIPAATAAAGGVSLQNGTKTLDIPCDMCTGRKERAVSSCLTCIASYCETHVQPHRTNGVLRLAPTPGPTRGTAGTHVSRTRAAAGGVLPHGPALHLRHLCAGGTPNSRHRVCADRARRQTGEC
ncbi:hypothetical protein PHYPO_G00130980 [Pangasianodon hypophthalmus]|uniref:RING-type domain-containing protein n=1 Tax=Pangasianodon hypophthalmus TaxID=310915 RepID=A0A5N5KJU9_PANHP|nr:hypothetical protein PHYPO_G00130980 [Pangasianodon hypophthalmus]